MPHDEDDCLERDDGQEIDARAEAQDQDREPNDRDHQVQTREHVVPSRRQQNGRRDAQQPEERSRYAPESRAARRSAGAAAPWKWGGKPR